MSPSADPAARRSSVAVDVGGTFTDLVCVDDLGRRTVVKVPSTPDDPARGVLDAVDAVARALGLGPTELLGACERFVHGSTVATNAVLERKLAAVGLLTTDGFRDALEIRRGIREDQWDHRAPWPPVVVPRHRRIGIPERTDAGGKERRPLDEAAVRAAASRLADDGVEAVAVSFLHSYLDDGHEQRAAELLRETWPGALTTASADLVPVLGEYARTSTAVINAGLVPRVGGYLERLAARLGELAFDGRLLLVASNGGTVPLDSVAARPVDLVLSGPAAVGGALASAADDAADDPEGDQPLVSMEIGGTSCDVAVRSGGIVPVVDGLVVGGYHLAVPAVDVHTVGAGGGTIARVDDAGLLHVGPQGAGADPGPAAYGRGGTEATATDAHLVLGRLRPGPYAGGTVRLDLDAARRALVDRIGRPLGLDAEAAAVGVLRLLEEHLRQAVETITIERGRDPRRMTLVAAGGAGGLHASAIARALGCRAWLVPDEAGVFCAAGMLRSDLRRDVTRSVGARLDEVGGDWVLARADEEAERLQQRTAEEWPADIPVTLDRFVDLRHPGQLWSVRVPLPSSATAASIRAGFEAEYRRLYGHVQPDGVLEVTAVVVAAHGELPRVGSPARPAADGPPEPVDVRRCFLDDATGWRDVPVHDGAALRPGHRLDGPFLVEARTTTVLGLPGDRAVVRPGGGLLSEVTR